MNFQPEGNVRVLSVESVVIITVLLLPIAMFDGDANVVLDDIVISCNSSPAKSNVVVAVDRSWIRF